MPQVVYIQPDGTENAVDVPPGLSVMDGAIRENLPGIVAECGGSCSCATCHVYVEEPWVARLGEVSDEESELLEFLDGARPSSRLSCQLVVTDELDGLRVAVADNGG